MGHRRVWSFVVYAPEDQIDKVYSEVKAFLSNLKQEAGVECDIDADAEPGEPDEVWNEGEST